MIKPREMRRVLIVSPAFPPMNAPDLQRARMSLPYYREYGWEPIVLTVDPAKQEGAREEALVSTLPEDVLIHRCGALSLKGSQRIGLGNLGLRAWLHLLYAGIRIIRREEIDLVFLTNTQFVTFTLGRIFRALLGVPYVIDLQDPWRTDYYQRPGSRKPPGGWKYQIARLQAWVLEGWSFRRLGGFMSVSQHYISDLRHRYRWFSAVPSDVIGFGASETDLVVARTLQPRSPADGGPPEPKANIIRFVYTGAAGPIMPHSLKVLFGGLRQFKARRPAEAARLRFEFLGTSYAPPGQGKLTVAPIADEFGVADQVIEVPHRLGHLECLRIQSRADSLLLLGSSDLAYSPSKLYPYYLSGRPILGLVFRHSYLEKLLNDLSCATVISFANDRPKDEAYDRLCTYFDHALAGFPIESLPVRNEQYFRHEFLAETLTGRQCALFDATFERSRRDEDNDDDERPRI